MKPLPRVGNTLKGNQTSRKAPGYGSASSDARYLGSSILGSLKGQISLREDSQNSTNGRMSLRALSL